MSKPRPNENVPTPPPRDLIREARRLERLRLVTSEPRVEQLRPNEPEPKRAA
jgi:hypothetical protein